MTLYRVPMIETNYGVVVIEADTLEEAERMLEDRDFDGTEQYYYNVTEVEFGIEGIEVDD